MCIWIGAVDDQYILKKIAPGKLLPINHRQTLEFKNNSNKQTYGDSLSGQQPPQVWLIARQREYRCVFLCSDDVREDL